MPSYKRLFAFGAVVALAGLVTVTASGQSQPQYRLGGAFIGSNGAGSAWNALQIPLDAAGQTAALRVNDVYYDAAMAGLLAAFGADSVSDYVGEEKMISRDTASYRTVAYATQRGNPPQLRLIVIMFGTIRFTGPDTYDVTYTVEVYWPESDADRDGYPDAGAAPLFRTDPAVDQARRVASR